MKLKPTDALIIVDPQYDFIEGGALAVEGGKAALDKIVEVMDRFADVGAKIITTQDWHPTGHSSFASSHEGMNPFDTIEKPYGTDTLWPDHCVQGSDGAKIYEPIAQKPEIMAIVRKGMNPAVDSYSGIADMDGARTGLSGLLKTAGVKRVFVCGLAYDFCVGFTAVDSAIHGFNTIILKDLTAAIGSNIEDIEQKFSDLGIVVEGN